MDANEHEQIDETLNTNAEKTNDIKKNNNLCSNDDLSELLNSALDDFKDCDDQNDLPSQQTKNVENVNTSDSKKPKGSNQSNAFSDILLNGTDGNFENNLENVMEQVLGADNIKAMFEELKNIPEQPGNSESASSTDKTINESHPLDFASAIDETLSNLEANTEGLKNINLSENDLQNMLGNFNDNDMLQNMMKTLLSKDLLYPSLSELNVKYPTFLLENEHNLSENDKIRYSKQSTIVSRLVEVYDEETENDSNQVKKSRFDTLMNLMQEMQSCGHPPKEIVGDFDPVDLSENQCSVM